VLAGKLRSLAARNRVRAALSPLCESGDPPGGPPDVARPPSSRAPRIGRRRRGLEGHAVIQFDEVIDEMGGGGGRGAGITGLANR